MVNTNIYSTLCCNIKILLTKNKNNLDNRENKIKEDLENANKFREQSEVKIKEYQIILENAKKEVSKIHLDSKSILDKDIQLKKKKWKRRLKKKF